MEEALVAYLLGNVGLSVLVDDRIKWSYLPQGEALPAIALHLVAGSPDYTMTGRDPVVGYLVQMDCWAGLRMDALTLKRALIRALDGLTSKPLQAFVESERDSFLIGDGPDARGDANFNRASLDVRVWFTDTF